MNPDEHAQLLRELVDELHQYDSANPYHDAAPLIARANQAAAELEGQREPSDEELIELSYKFWSRDNPSYYQDASCNYARAVIGSLRSLRQARFGHGEESA